MSKKSTPFARKCEIAVNGSEIAYTRFYFSNGLIHAFAIKIDFRGIADNFNAIPVPNLQSEMQKAGSSHGTGSFFRVIFNFSARRIFPATLSKHCFLLSDCWSYVFFCYRKVSLVLLSYRYLKSLKVESRQISIIIFYNIEKNSKKYAKNIYKDTNVCYADAVTDRPFC